MAELRLEQSLINDRYEILERKGQGSYAEVFLARDQKQAGLQVIIKALNVYLQGTPDAELEQTLVENFRNEGAALDAVRHANIIKRMGEGADVDKNGLPFHYLVLEYMAGGDLLQKCRQRPLDFDMMMGYTRQVCDALSYAHKCNVIHRDIKPNNLLLNGDGQIVKIADFGVAKISPRADEEVTRVGTDIYAPPEHHPMITTGELVGPMLTPSADIYSLAKTIYTLLSGHAPRQFKHRAISELPATLQAQPWAEPLINVLRRATDGKIDKRYASISEFYRDLKTVYEQSDEVTRIRPRANTLANTVQNTTLDTRSNTTSDAALQTSQNTLQNTAPVSLSDTPVNTSQHALSESRQPARIIVQFPASPAPPKPVKLVEPNSNGKTTIEPDEAPLAKTIKIVRPEPGRKNGKTVKAAERKTFWDRADEFVLAHRKKILAIWALALFLGLSIWIYHFTYEAFQPGQGSAVVMRDVSVRSGPTTGSEVVGYLRHGAKLRVIKRQANNWYLVKIIDAEDIKTANSSQGWVYGDFLDASLAGEEEQ